MITRSLPARESSWVGQCGFGLKDSVWCLGSRSHHSIAAFLCYPPNTKHQAPNIKPLTIPMFAATELIGQSITWKGRNYLKAAVPGGDNRGKTFTIAQPLAD